MIGHGRWRRRTALLAAGALEAGEREAAEAHVLRCARCAAERAGWQALLEGIEAPPPAEPPLDFHRLEAAVRGRLASRGVAGARPWTARAGPWPAVAAAAVVLAVAGALGRPALAPPPPPPAAAATPEAAEEGRDEMLRRMERTVARAHAARYLTEAQDLLVTVTAGPQPCPRRARAVEVEEEARRSRELLARRALLVDLGSSPVAPARPVIDEVEAVLREVAALPACARRRRVQELERDIERRRLLMKIDLMTRELLG